MRRLLFLCSSLFFACGSSDPAGLETINLGDDHSVDALEADVWVLRTEYNVPHIYAQNEHDLYVAQGFIMARDRYVQIELTRRFGNGTLSELLGDLGVAIDADSRGQGMRFVTEQVWNGASPELKAQFEAFAEGVNRYVLGVKRGQFRLPEEVDLVASLVDIDDPKDALVEIEGRDVAAVAAVIMSRLGYESSDLDRAEARTIAMAATSTRGRGQAWNDGVMKDIMGGVLPLHAVSQVPPTGQSLTASGQVALTEPLAIESGLLRRAASGRRRFLDLLQKPHGVDFGSNAWAVGPSGTGGGAILANDGHLPLTVPSLFYAMCLDDKYRGNGETVQCGLYFPGLPLMAVGTNGKVAWGQTYLDGDVTDFFREEIRLDANGAPAASMFEGEFRPLEEVVETYVVTDDEDQTWSRYTTFDGRWLVSIEGEVLEDPDASRPVLLIGGEYVVPGDQNGDGVVEAVSFDWTAFDGGKTLAAVVGFSKSQNVEEFQEHTKKLVGYAQNVMVADSDGGIMYTAWHGMPCRDYIKQDGFQPGDDPQSLLDGTRHGGFTIETNEAGEVNESGCIVPFDVGPRSVSPARGFISTANHDPLGYAFDNRLDNDPHYIGGPWSLGFRGNTIETRLAEQVTSQTADIAATQTLQADQADPLALNIAGEFVGALTAAETATADPQQPHLARLAALQAQHGARLGDVKNRIMAWVAKGAPAKSGVETFYNTPSAESRTDAVATMIFAAWFRKAVERTLADEGVDFAFQPEGSKGQIRLLLRLLKGRDGNSTLTSIVPQTNESVFFDDVRTSSVVENSDEILVLALIDVLDELSDADTGFGPDVDSWLWGLEHRVRFVPLLEEVGSDNQLVRLVSFKFGLTTEDLPLAADIPRDDPRAELQSFPRPGAWFSVDAANPGLSGSYEYSHGPVMRMVIHLDGKTVRGQNVLPGGQSALRGNEHYTDQAALWLGNESYPIRYHAEDVAEGAVERELLLP